MWGEFETVYAVTDYYDGILAGVADFQGSPHIFVRDEETPPLYRLTLISGAAASLDWSPLNDIWNPTPAVEALVRTAISARDDGFVAVGEFIPVDGSPPLKPIMRVRWNAERDGV
jgi:hypothetical protein